MTNSGKAGKFPNYREVNKMGTRLYRAPPLATRNLPPGLPRPVSCRINWSIASQSGWISAILPENAHFKVKVVKPWNCDFKH